MANPDDSNVLLGVVREDIKELRTFLQLKLDGHDARIRDLEQQASATRALSKAGLMAIPFAVSAFSFALYSIWG